MADQPIVISHTTERAALATSPKRIFWGAIFAGVVLTLVIQLLLNLLGLSIGAATIDPASGDSPKASTLGFGAGMWWIASGLIALFIGGWAAARLANLWSRTNCVLHGLVVWGTASLVLLWMAFSATASLVTGALGVVGNTMQTAMQTVGEPVAEQVARGETPMSRVGQGGLQQVRSELQALLREGAGGQAREAGAPRGEAAEPPSDPQLVAAIERVLVQDVEPGEREDVAWDFAQRTNMSSSEAERTLERWGRTAQQGTTGEQGEQVGQAVRAKVEEVREQAPEVAEEAASGLAKAAFWAFFALLLGAISAGAGGAVAAGESRVKPDDELDREATYGSSNLPT